MIKDIIAKYINIPKDSIDELKEIKYVRISTAMEAMKEYADLMVKQANDASKKK